MALFQIAEPGLSAAPHEHRLAVGIDLGTTNSLVASVISGSTEVILDEGGAAILPSVVHYAADGTVTVGAVALRDASRDPKNTISSAKRLIGRTMKDLADVHNLPYDLVDDPSMVRIATSAGVKSPVEVSAEILRSLAKRAEDRLGGDLTGAVITVPAYFDDAQRQATKDAARLANLTVLRLLNEPTAAALAYGLDNGAEGTYMVYDLGGGTFDVSILDISCGVIEVLATAGNNHLGGDDFDQCIVDYLVSEFKKENKIDLSRDPVAMQRVREAAEKAKIELSSMKQTTVEQPYIAVGKQGPLHMQIPLTRAKFNDLTYHLVQATREPVNQAINDSGISISQISKVLMVGGSSRIPAVQDLVQSMTGSLPFKGINPDECVAMGACLQAGVLCGSVKGLLLLDVTPLSLGIETLGGVCTRIIERNTTLPIRKSQIFTTASSFQSSVDIHVLQGERPMAHQNKELGRFQLTGIRRAPRGVPQIEVTFSIDANGIVNVSAKDLDTGKAQQITITASSNMSRDEIDRAVRDAQRYAAEDAKLKAEATARDRCEQLIFQAGNAKNLSKDDKVRVAEAVKNAKRAVKSKDAAQMNEAAGQLETLLNEVGVHIDPNAEYHGSASYENPNNDFSDDAVDADFEKL